MSYSEAEKRLIELVRTSGSEGVRQASAYAVEGSETDYLTVMYALGFVIDEDILVPEDLRDEIIRQISGYSYFDDIRYEFIEHQDRLKKTTKEANENSNLV
uniref:hypothetical protein n=1 Tax=Vaginimicrobium propionicum TaxID=1871034 RepID=UPI000970BA0A|nr:hypothetical protein [Vaginimicrobium propionicum]